MSIYFFQDEWTFEDSDDDDGDEQVNHTSSLKVSSLSHKLKKQKTTFGDVITESVHQFVMKHALVPVSVNPATAQ